MLLLICNDGPIVLYFGLLCNGISVLSFSLYLAYGTRLAQGNTAFFADFEAKAKRTKHQQLVLLRDIAQHVVGLLYDGRFSQSLIMSKRYCREKER